MNSSKDYYDLRGRDTNENLSIRHDQPSILPGLDRNSIWSHLILAAQQLINESDPSFNSTVMQSSRSFSERLTTVDRDREQIVNELILKNARNSLSFLPFRSIRILRSVEREAICGCESWGKFF